MLSLRITLLPALAIAVLACVASAVARAEPVGRLYTAVGSGINEFDVGSEGSLTSKGAAAGGATSLTFPGSIAMAQTAGGESLYELTGTGATETIHQYSVDPATGLLSAKSPPTIATIPLIASEEQHMIAVFNPAAHGEAGQNALYVLSGPDFEHTYLYMFDIDPVTGALSAAGEIPVRGMGFGGFLAYSGSTIVVEGSATDGTGFQNATIEPASGVPVFPGNPYVPCPEHSCDDGKIAMLDPEHVLDETIVPSGKKVDEFVAGFQALTPGEVWLPLFTTAFEGPAAAAFTPAGGEYLAVEQLGDGTTFLEGIGADGLSEGHTVLAGESTKALSPAADFALGDDLAIANVNEIDTGLTTGAAYRLSPSGPPGQASVGGVLGKAMTGFLFSEATGGGPVTGGSPEGSGGEKTSTPGASSFSLAVAVTGKGSVSGGAIACPAACSASLPAGTVLALAEKPAPGYAFAGWSDSCSGKGACAVTLSAPRTVKATFLALPPPATKIGSVKIAGGKTTIRFKGSGGYGKLTFRCRFGNAKKAVKCASPLVLSHLTPGKHRFSVYAVDSRPVADPTPAHSTFRTK